MAKQRRARAAQPKAPGTEHAHAHETGPAHDNAHPHPHPQEHSHAPAHDHAQGHGHGHPHDHAHGHAHDHNHAHDDEPHEIEVTVAQRLRRLRRTPALRAMVREHTVTPADFIYPLFVRAGNSRPIASMPGQQQLSLKDAAAKAREVRKLGIPAVLLFTALDESAKDAVGSASWDPHGLMAEGIDAVKQAAPELCVVADTCFCEFTAHGHCGVIDEDHGSTVDNDATLENLGRQALTQVEAGADMVAPSGMMDGAVGAIRGVLDHAGYLHIPIMGYSAKYASGFYGPFRDAAGSAPQFGDRAGYQMDPANARMGLSEVAADVAEEVDIVMVKPGLAYLDMVWRVREKFGKPTAVYNVSGESAMVKAAAEKGWIDEKRVVLEILTGFKRAGADLIISYHAPEACRWL